MRIQALILLFPFAVFLIETASFVPAMTEACTLKATGAEVKKSSCCMKPDKQEPGQCPTKEQDDKKTEGNGCTDNPDCTTCPLCYIFIFQPQYEWPGQQVLFKKNYGLLTTSFISSYTPDAWKPPNGPAIHS